MRTAIAFDKSARQHKQVTADQWARNVEQDPSLPERVELRAPRTNKPVVFRGPYTRMGNEERVRPHFAYAAGHAPPQSHVFEREHETLEESIRKGKKILLSLNNDFSYVQVDFRGDVTEKARKLEGFQRMYEGKYVTLSVHSADEALTAIKKIHGLLRANRPRATMDENVFALYRGGVVPYHQFYLGDRREDVAALYDSMHVQLTGVLKGATRVVGMPRLIKFIASNTTRQQEGLKGLKGAVYQPHGARGTYFSQLVFSDVHAKQTDVYAKLRHEVVKSKEGVYVLASPTITIGQAEESGWYMMRWMISDIEAQTTPVQKKGQAPKMDGQDQTLYRPPAA